MDTLFGIPAHPLVVHAPVVLLPLAVIGVLLMMVRSSWYEQLKWPVLAVTAVGAFGAILAASSGEELEELVEDGESRAALNAIHEHAEAGEMARTLAILFFVAVVLYVIVPWFLARRAAASVADVAPSRSGPSWLRPVLMLFVAVTAVGSLVTIVNAGHSGAESVWDEETEQVDDED